MGKIRMTAVAAVAVAMLPAAACTMEDARYFGWNRYVDKDDGYEILLPPKWEAEEELMPGIRGTRLYSTEITARECLLYDLRPRPQERRS